MNWKILLTGLIGVAIQFGIAIWGWALAFRSAVGVVLALLQPVPLAARIRAEERLLREHFGAEYDAYCAHAKWRLVPGIY